MIAAIDSQIVDDAESVGFRLGVKPLGGTAQIAVLRDGKTLDLPLKLASAPETPPRDALTIHSRSPFDGALVMNLSPAVSEELSLDGARQGVVVASVGENSTAAQVGVQKGDIVVAVNGATDRHDPRPRTRLFGAQPLVGPHHPPRRPDDPDAARRLKKGRAPRGSVLPGTRASGRSLGRKGFTCTARPLDLCRADAPKSREREDRRSGPEATRVNEPLEWTTLSLTDGYHVVLGPLVTKCDVAGRSAQSPSSGVTPFGLPSAESVIFSIRISAFLRRSSQRAFSASPRS